MPFLITVISSEQRRSTGICARPDSSRRSRTWWLTDGTHTEILNWLDDHSRYALSVTAHRRITGPIVLTDSPKPVPAKAFQLPPH